MGKPLKEEGTALSSSEGPEKRESRAGEKWKTAVSSRGWIQFGCSLSRSCEETLSQ